HAELSRDAFPSSEVRQRAHLPNVVRHRLLEIEVFPGLEHAMGRMEVRVIGSADDDRVDLVLDLIEHLPVVAEAPRFRELLVRVPRARIVDVAERDDVLAELRYRIEVRATSPADADHGDIELLVRRRGAD